MPSTEDQVVSSGFQTDLPRVDLSKANDSKRNNTTLERKWFRVQRQGSLKVATVDITASNIEESFTKACRIVQIEENDATIVYPMRTSEGKDDITISNDEFVKESLMTFFLTCEEGSKIIVVPSQTKQKARDYRFTEYGYNSIIKKTFSVNRQYYEYLQENVFLIESFLNKRVYLNLVLGKECLNWLNPGHFYCTLKGCNKIIALGYFNNISRIFAHYQTHASQGDSCSKIIMRRHNHMIDCNTALLLNDEESGSKKKKKKWVKVADFDSKLEKLNNEVVEPDVINKEFIENETAEFKGRHLLINVSVLQKILLSDGDALQSIPKVAPKAVITSYYTKITSNNASAKSRSTKTSDAAKRSNSEAVVPKVSNSVVKTGSKKIAKDSNPVVMAATKKSSKVSNSATKTVTKTVTKTATKTASKKHSKDSVVAAEKEGSKKSVPSTNIDFTAQKAGNMSTSQVVLPEKELLRKEAVGDSSNAKENVRQGNSKAGDGQSSSSSSDSDSSSSESEDESPAVKKKKRQYIG